ncbi:MAG: amidohydrolase family protein [Hymenobacteraceae bacterium]|nr:amidohydrolase family protein [Hymenobacteraceae bacterium]
MLRFLPVFLLLAACRSAPDAPPAPELLLENGFLVDPRTRLVTKGSLLLRGGRIVRRYAQPPVRYRGPRLDVAGRYVLPALADLHVHSIGNSGATATADPMSIAEVTRRQLYCGVTRVLDLFNAEDSVFALRNRQRVAQTAHPLTGATLYCAGPALTCPGGHGTEYGSPTRTVASPVEAERAIASLATRRPDVVKIIYDHFATWLPTIDQPTLRAAVRAAPQRHLKTVVHVGTWQDAREALQAGATAVTHVPPGPLPADLSALFIARGAYFIPALTVQTELAHFGQDSTLLADSLLRQVASPALLRSYRQPDGYPPQIVAFSRWQARTEPDVQRSVRALNAAGVKLLTGTDAGNPGTFQGYSLHRELELLVGAGLTSWEALTATTVRAGEFLGEPIGLAVGDRADLLVLRCSPVGDIRHTRTLVHVIQRGRLVERAALLAASRRLMR